ncbi:MAG: type II secretion system F family protein [Lachnospiraceae bacterium]|nr:type II secretion system F family protein [Lachnospiraceae bacterium]
MRTLTAAFGITALLSFVFYDSFVPGLAAFPFTAVFLLLKERERLRKRDCRRLKADFLMAARIFSDYLRSACSPENAVQYSLKELSELCGKDSDMVTEWQLMGRELRLGRTLEEVFADFAERSGVREIRDFSEVLAIVNRSGGALHEVIRTVTMWMSEQQAEAAEIRSRLSGKLLELRLMEIVPVVILLYVRFASPELLSVMYARTAGRLVMSGFLALYLGVVFLSEHILKKTFCDY